MDKEKNRLAQSKFQKKRRLEALEHYGGRCSQCGIREPRCLTLVSRKDDKIKKEGTQIYNVLKSKGYPKGYFILCNNCRAIKKTGKAN